MFDKLTPSALAEVGRTLSGKTVLSGELTPNQFKQSRIDMTALKRGLYLVKLSGNRINRVVKVVKE